ALLNSNSSVEARFTIAGFFGSGFATGAAGAGVGAGAATGAGAGAGAGSGFAGSCVAQPAKIAALLKAAATKACLTLVEPLMEPPLFGFSRRPDLSTGARR